MHIRLPVASILPLLICACFSVVTSGQSPTASQEPAPAEVADPMASFARMVPGEWWMTIESGASQFDTWHWGPGQHSIREVNHSSDGVGNVWGQVVYWHPGRKQICLLGVSAFARGVFEGTIRFDGEIADAVFDMYQTGDHRKLGQRWAFDGPDKYRDTLLEATGPDGLQPLAEWERVRSKTLTARRPPTAQATPRPSERLKALESLPGHTWEAKGDQATGEAFHIQSTFEWVPDVDAMYARTSAQTKDGEPIHLLDAYIYHHTGADALRCLALSKRGGVYEGDVTVLEGGGLQLDLMGYEGDLIVPHVVRFDFEKEGTLRQRIWSLEGRERTLLLDLEHEELEPKSE